MKRLGVLAFAVAALAAPSSAFAGGVVLKVQRATQLVAITQSKHGVTLVHTRAASRLHVGERVAVRAHALRNGTLAASNIRVVGRAHRVHFEGLLLARSHGRLVVSAGGAVVSIRSHGRTLASAQDSGPSPGSTVGVTATVGAGGELDEDSVTTVSASSPGGSIEGTLTLGSGTITVVSEHMALVINVPTGFDLSAFQNGQEVLAVFAQQTDGTLLLTSLSGDNSAQQANEQQSTGDGTPPSTGTGTPGTPPATSGDDGSATGSGDDGSTTSSGGDGHSGGDGSAGGGGNDGGGSGNGGNGGGDG